MIYCCFLLTCHCHSEPLCFLCVNWPTIHSNPSTSMITATKLYIQNEKKIRKTYFHFSAGLQRTPKGRTEPETPEKEPHFRGKKYVPLINFKENDLSALLILLPFVVSTTHAHFSKKKWHASVYILAVCFMTTCFSPFRYFITILSRFPNIDSAFILNPFY